MRLVKIKNKYMYKPRTEAERRKYKPEGSHLYLVYKDKKTKETRAIRLTHVYEVNKVEKIEKGDLFVTKIPTVKYPSGVRNEYTTKDILGRPLDLKNVKAVNTGDKAVYVNGAKADKIKNFAKKKDR